MMGVVPTMMNAQEKALLAPQVCNGAWRVAEHGWAVDPPAWMVKGVDGEGGWEDRRGTATPKARQGKEVLHMHKATRVVQTATLDERACPSICGCAPIESWFGTVSHACLQQVEVMAEYGITYSFPAAPTDATPGDYCTQLPANHTRPARAASTNHGMVLILNYCSWSLSTQSLGQLLAVKAHVICKCVHAWNSEPRCTQPCFDPFPCMVVACYPGAPSTTTHGCGQEAALLTAIAAAATAAATAADGPAGGGGGAAATAVAAGGGQQTLTGHLALPRPAPLSPPLDLLDVYSGMGDPLGRAEVPLVVRQLVARGVQEAALRRSEQVGFGALVWWGALIVLVR